MAADNLKMPRANFKHFAKKLQEEGITDEDQLRVTSDSKLRTCGLPAILIGNLAKILKNLETGSLSKQLSKISLNEQNQKPDNEEKKVDNKEQK